MNLADSLLPTIPKVEVLKYETEHLSFVGRRLANSLREYDRSSMSLGDFIRGNGHIHHRESQSFATTLFQSVRLTRRQKDLIFDHILDKVRQDFFEIAGVPKNRQSINSAVYTLR